MSREELIRFWPTPADVADCVKTNAEASSAAVLLAVHQPMRFEKRVIGGRADVLGTCSEDELLAAFLEPQLSDGLIIAPIVGSSGIGKSHVIRWLDAQLQRMPGRRVVIRIPKWTSLKGVLGILLEKVQGTAYESFRNELARAQEELDPKEAAGLLCEMLAHTLLEMWERARERLVANPGDAVAKDHAAFCAARMLPSLLRNQVLRDQHFVRARDGDGVVKRLVEHLTEERTAGDVDDRQQNFTAEDLVFDPNIDLALLGRHELKALQLLEREDRRATAARILNAALDSAKQRLLRLDPTVSDLFEQVRRQLLEEKTELVLLVEDFAVLSGLQKQLLQIITKEAFRDGKQQLCTMRTALAYTTGYMDTATVLTRASVEYRIPDEPGTETEILGSIESLVGAYLNAARVGQARLDGAYKERAAAEKKLGSWIPRFEAEIEPDGRATLDAFGRSQHGHELFPFNEAAVREFAREGCLDEGGRFVYNPRFVIQNVLKPVLAHRGLFESGQFPPGSLGTKLLSARVTEHVRRRVTQAELPRYERLLTYWGGAPSEVAELAQLDERVCGAFELDKERLGVAARPIAAAEVSRPRPPEAQAPAAVATTGGAPQRSPEEERWEAVLEDWRAGGEMKQKDARLIRGWVVEGLEAYTQWDWYLFRPLQRDSFKRWSSCIYLPRAAGNESPTALEAMASICTEQELADTAESARIHSELMAVVRFHAVGGQTWDYENAEGDLARYATLFARIAPRAQAFVRARYFKPDWDAVPLMVEGLLIGGRLLGIGEAQSKKHADLIASLVVPAPNGGREGDGDAQTEWGQLVHGLSALRGPGGGRLDRKSASWTSHLLNLVGARQGQADTVHAVDVERLRPALQEIAKSWTLSGELPGHRAGAPEFSEIRATAIDLRKRLRRVPKRQAELFAWHGSFREWMGFDTDKDELVRGVKELVERSVAAGLARGADSKRLLALIEEFRTAKVVEALRVAQDLGPEADLGGVLNALGRGYEPVVALCSDLQQTLDQFLAVVENEVEAAKSTHGENPLADAAATLNDELLATKQLMEVIRDHACS